MSIVQPAQNDEIDSQADGGHPKHQPTLHLMRMVQSFHGHPGDPTPDEPQSQTVRLRRQNTCAAIAIAHSGMRGTSRNSLRQHGQGKGRNIGQHVCRIGQQGQGIREPTAGEFDDREDGRNPKRGAQWP